MTEANIDDSTPHPFIRTQQVVASARWLLVLRWAAGLGVLIATWVACSVLDLGVWSTPLYATGVAIMVYNAGLWAWLNRLQADSESPHASYNQLAHLQVVLDWLAMATLIHFSGGIESPIIFFFVFHILISSLLFSQRVAYVYAVMAQVLVGGVTALEWAGRLPHVHVEGFLAGDSYRNPAYVAGVMGTFAITGLVAVYLASSIAEQLRRREDQLKTLYLAAQTINSSLNLQEVLDRLVRATAQAMNVRAASIGLLDSTGSEIDVVAAYGISQAYLDKGPNLVARSRAYDTVLSTGEPLILQGDIDPTWFQYPEEKEKEGIRSILYVPLTSRQRILGVIRVHSQRPSRFSADDAHFLSAIGAQGAVAIENALAYQALKKLDVDKSQFVRAVTHELRSPVTGAQSLLRGVLKGYAGGLNDRQREVMGRLNRRLDKLEALINDLLDLAAGRSDLQVEESRPLALMARLEHVLASVEPQAREKDQNLIFERPAGDPIVMATEEGLDRILVNLIGNAVKYTPERGTVTVTVREYDRQVGIVIKDTGIGIPADSLPRLFQEFYRAPNAKAFETGTGLGLVIVKELVESFNGRISVESQEGKGTTFTVHLPVVGGHDHKTWEAMERVQTQEEVV